MSDFIEPIANTGVIEVVPGNVAMRHRDGTDSPVESYNVVAVSQSEVSRTEIVLVSGFRTEARAESLAKWIRASMTNGGTIPEHNPNAPSLAPASSSEVVE